MIYHLSHTDLDGYSCQMIMANTMQEIKFYNANYGKPITEAFNSILEVINKYDELLITDLNLDLDQSEMIDSKQKEIGFKLNLWDHHGTGKPSAEIYEWYHLDTSKCATAITFEKVSNKLPDEELFLNYVEIINVYDMWDEKSPLFERSKSLNQNLMDRRKLFPSVMTASQNKFNVYFIQESLNLFIDLNLSIQEIEMKLYSLEREYFSIQSMNFDPNIAIHVLRIQGMYNSIINSGLRTEFEFNGMKAEVYYGLNNIFQEFSHLRLERTDLDFAVNINNQGYISFRSKEVDVSEIAQKLFDGGGHKNASGGKLLDVGKKRFKDEDLVPLFLKQLNQ